jgi:hypothetical protein
MEDAPASREGDTVIQVLQVDHFVSRLEVTRRGDAIYINVKEGEKEPFLMLSLVVPDESVYSLNAIQDQAKEDAGLLDKIRELVCPDVDRWPNG